METDRDYVYGGNSCVVLVALFTMAEVVVVTATMVMIMYTHIYIYIYNGCGYFGFRTSEVWGLCVVFWTPP